MKDLTTGEVSGPPLPHDEYVEQQQQVEAADVKSQQSQRPGTRTRQQSSDDLDSLTVVELKDRAKDAGVEHYSTLNKQELIDTLRQR